jgi:hypothetical protein
LETKKEKCTLINTQNIFKKYRKGFFQKVNDVVANCHNLQDRNSVKKTSYNLVEFAGLTASVQTTVPNFWQRFSTPRFVILSGMFVM